MATQKVLLVSEKTIKEQSIIEQTVDSKVLSSIIWNVQELQLKAILGKDLYTSVLQEVFTSVSTSANLSTTTQELLNSYVTPFLIYATLVDFIVLNNYKLSNKGLMKLNDNSATSTNQSEIEYAKNYYDNFLSVYKNNLINYLKTDSNNDDKDLNVDETSYTIGWYLETRREKCF